MNAWSYVVYNIPPQMCKFGIPNKIFDDFRKRNEKGGTSTGKAELVKLCDRNFIREELAGLDKAVNANRILQAKGISLSLSFPTPTVPHFSPSKDGIRYPGIFPQALNQSHCIEEMLAWNIF
ncbi:unnamed protein product, partial [Sphenostylis stenocarpa]